MPSLRLLRVAQLLFLALVFGLTAPVPGGFAATPADAYAVHGIDVDVTAAGVAAAKEQALAEGQRHAFRRLLERLTMPVDHGRLPSVDAQAYVRDFSVEAERASSVRYIATLTVRFNATAVRKLLRDSGLHYAEARQRPVVVVPVYKGLDGRLVLWDDPNPWRAAWHAAVPGGLVPLVLPAGDLADLQALDPEHALAGDAERLAALGERYRSPDVLVAAAAPSPNGTGLDVSLTGTGGVPRPFETRSFDLAEGIPLDAALRRVAMDIAHGMDTMYKQGNLLQFDRAATIAALVPLRGLEDWLAVRERLGQVTQVRRYEVVSLSREEAALVLHTVGNTEQVKTALAGAGLSLEWTDGYWTMRPGARR